MTALTQKELDRAKCQTPGCDHDACTLFVVARCHPRAACTVSYAKGTGRMTIRCATCKQPVTVVRIATE